MLELNAIIGGRFRIDQILGTGGMGIVAAATHLELGNRVAIKVLHDELAQNPTIVERFIREARAVVNLRTEHVCRVFDVGRLDNGAPYIVMELLHGSDLARATASKPLPIVTAVDYVMQACVALAEAHAVGIVHRDLKPANLFVTRRADGGPLLKVLDFGIAKAMDAAGPQLTHATGIMGSPGYMSPEQLVSARDVDARTDIWALGVTLYQLVSARMPFASTNLTEIAVKVATDPPAPLDVDPALRAVILRCLEKQPASRYPTVLALALDLAPFASPDGRRATTSLIQHGGSPQIAVPAPTAVPADAATAASIASSHAPATPAPDQPPPHRPATHPPPAGSRRWPLIVFGGLALIGATVAITLAIGGDKPQTTVPTSAPASTATPIDARPPSTTEPPRPAPGGDPWAIATESDVATEAEQPDPGTEAEPPDAEPDPEAPMAPSIAGVGIDAQMRQLAEQAKLSCRNFVSNPTIASIPSARAGVAMCWCILGDQAKAQAVYNRLGDAALRNSARITCQQYGIKLTK